MKWASAICASPRSENLLNETLNSIQQAGWNPNIYSEPKTTPIAFVERPIIYGPWVNWLVALFEMYQTTNAEYFSIFEDDIKICKNTMKYIENSISLLGDFAYISLYTPAHLHKKGDRVFHNESRGLWTYGTQAIIFSREKLCSFLLNKRVFSHRENDIYFFGQKKDHAGNDILLGMWAEEVGLPIFYHSPSLVQHCGIYSTQGSASHQAMDFPGESFNALELINKDCVVLRSTDILL